MSEACTVSARGAEAAGKASEASAVCGLPAVLASAAESALLTMTRAWRTKARRHEGLVAGMLVLRWMMMPRASHLWTRSGDFVNA